MRVKEKNRTKGFTVLELLVTLAILGILSVLAVPSLIDTLSRMSVNSALSLARSEAVKRVQDVSICPTLDGSDCVSGSWASGWVVFVDSNNDADGGAGSIDTGDTVIRVFESLADLNLTITYDNKGYGKNAAILTFRLCPGDGNAANAKALEISFTGRARISDDVGSCA